MPDLDLLGERFLWNIEVWQIALSLTLFILSFLVKPLTRAVFGTWA